MSAEYWRDLALKGEGGGLESPDRIFLMLVFTESELSLDCNSGYGDKACRGRGNADGFEDGELGDKGL